jgi:hypothetical protein
MEPNFKKTAGVVFAALAISIAVSDFAEARRGNDSAEARRERDMSGFATSRCKRASCFASHPSGSWVHPLHHRLH